MRHRLWRCLPLGVARIGMLWAALLVAPRPVDAHAFLDRAVPPVGAVLPDAPTGVRLSFTEAIEAQFCTVAVQDAGGARVDTGDLRIASDGGKTLLLGLLKLPPGTYTVIWHVTSVDTHKTEGRFQFTVAH